MNSVLIIYIIHAQDEFETGALDLDHQDKGFQAGGVVGRGGRHLFFCECKKAPTSLYYGILSLSIN